MHKRPGLHLLQNWRYSQWYVKTVEKQQSEPCVTEPLGVLRNRTKSLFYMT